MKPKLLSKKSLIQSLVILLICGLLTGVYIFIERARDIKDDQQVTNTIQEAVTQVDAFVRENQSMPPALQNVDGVEYLPSVGSYEYFVCGNFKRQTTKPFGADDYSQAVTKVAKYHDYNFEGASVLGGHELLYAHKAGANCYYFESSEAKNIYRNPVRHCGGGYGVGGGYNRILGASGSTLNVVALFKGQPISKALEIDISQAKIVSKTCEPKVLSDLKIGKTIAYYYQGKDAESILKLVIIQD